MSTSPSNNGSTNTGASNASATPEQRNSDRSGDRRNNRNNRERSKKGFKNKLGSAQIPKDKVFEPRDDKGKNEKQAQFESTLACVKDYLRQNIDGKEGKIFLLHMLQHGNENFQPLFPQYDLEPEGYKRDMAKAVYGNMMKSLAGLQSGRQHLCSLLTSGLSSPGMIAKLKSDDKFETIMNEGDVVSLLQLMRRICTSFEKHVYLPSSIAANISSFYNTFQGADEDLNEFH